VLEETIRGGGGGGDTVAIAIPMGGNAGADGTDAIPTGLRLRRVGVTVRRSCCSSSCCCCSDGDSDGSQPSLRLQFLVLLLLVVLLLLLLPPLPSLWILLLLE
jgi:hypothetical protein